MDYSKLLKRAKDQLPEVKESSERFEIPKVKGHIQGKNTIISNINDIADTLNRPVKHILKYLNKALAAKGVIRKEKFLIFNTKLSASRINEKVEEYAERFVICGTCGKPDTKLNRVGNNLFMKCQACGAKKAVME